MRPARLTLAVLCSSAALLAGCDGSPSGPKEFDPVGTLSFTYSGPISGSFQATGEMAPGPDGLPQPTTGATGLESGGVLTALAYRARTATRGDGFALVLGDVSARGTLQMNPLACQQQALTACRVGLFLPDVDPAELGGTIDPTALSDRTYVLALGSITVTERSDLRVRGTFQGVAFPANDQSLQNMLTIGDGKFDVPIRTR